MSAVVLAGDDGSRVLGLPACERNRRVLRRAGMEIRDRVPQSADPVLLVLPTTLLTPALLDHLPPAPGACCLVDAGGRAAAVWGPGFQVASIVRSAAPDWGLPVVTLPPGAAFDVSTREGRRAAARSLLRATAKGTDGWVARHLNRPISRAISHVMLRLGLTANHASALSLLTGLAAAWYAAQPSWPALVLAGAFFHLASVVDGVDGEMARVTLTESPGGARLDAIVDISTYVLCCLAFGIGWIRAGLGAPDVALVAGVTVGLLVAFVHGAWFMRRYAPDASWVFIDRCVARAARDSGRPTLRGVRAAFLLMRRDAFALIFFVLSFTGTRSVYFLAIGAGVIVALLTFWVQGERLAAAAVEERGLMASAASGTRASGGEGGSDGGRTWQTWTWH